MFSPPSLSPFPLPLARIKRSGKDITTGLGQDQDFVFAGDKHDEVVVVEKRTIISLVKTGVLKLFWLATPIFVFRNLATLKMQNITQKAFIWKLFGKIDKKF